MSALPQFPINDRFVLNQDEAWYTLSIELQVPIDTIMLQSNVPLDVQDIDKSSAVVSYTPPDTEVGTTHCLCTLSVCTLQLIIIVHELCMRLYSFHHNRRMCVCVRACAYVCVCTHGVFVYALDQYSWDSIVMSDDNLMYVDHKILFNN